MKILCIIDSLGSGGAQRQMVNLACGMSSKGYSVEFFVYHQNLNFFRSSLVENNILVHEGGFKRFRFISIILFIARLYRQKNYDAVISFMDGPNFLAEISQFIALKKVRLIVSERKSFQMESFSFRLVFFRLFHTFATHVVSNSHNHTLWLNRKFWLRNKTVTIYNGYPIDTFPQPRFLNTCIKSFSDLTFLVVGRVDSGKNGFRLLQAFIRFYHLHGFSPNLLWAGRQEQDPASLHERNLINSLLNDNPEINRVWSFLGERNDISELLNLSDALIHVSLYEGLPNAVCESFIAARPVIASNVCDHPILVEDGVRGILCDPFSPESICSAIEKYIFLSPTERILMGNNARSYAESNLSIDRMVSQFKYLISQS